ncbi:MAG TPA: 16S rRNA (adenine(1518)-N(6)/adenine(1519)-N(6))-dimethyltransferase RsmA [Bacteroidota bacterium]|nr:16S rRNA (adenine(1518)-N(6)/adenine(1519)-N(6))-dimethyltransferase RsmA [Bacteroidota bacterium]
MLPPKKSLGQHFLRDDNIARKIIDSLHLSPEDVVIEIGPGQGDLTKFLIRPGVRMLGIEVDPRAVNVLRDRFGTGLDVLEQDVLSVHLAELSLPYGQSFCVVGNIPYYITSEILFWLFDQRGFFRHATLMMQAEVAQRLVAEPDSKEYGILSIMTQFYSHSRLLFKVSRNSFHPIPRVDSAVVRIEPKPSLACADERLFRNVVRRTFGTRRKTLRNGLRMMGFSEGRLDGLPFDLTRRPQQLTLSEFAHLTTLLAPFANEVQLSY